MLTNRIKRFQANPNDHCTFRGQLVVNDDDDDDLIPGDRWGRRFWTRMFALSEQFRTEDRAYRDCLIIVGDYNALLTHVTPAIITVQQYNTVLTTVVYVVCGRTLYNDYEATRQFPGVFWNLNDNLQCTVEIVHNDFWRNGNYLVIIKNRYNQKLKKNLLFSVYNKYIQYYARAIGRKCVVRKIFIGSPSAIITGIRRKEPFPGHVPRFHN